MARFLVHVLQHRGIEIRRIMVDADDVHVACRPLPPDAADLRALHRQRQPAVAEQQMVRIVFVGTAASPFRSTFEVQAEELIDIVGRLLRIDVQRRFVQIGKPANAVFHAALNAATSPYFSCSICTRRFFSPVCSPSASARR